MERSNLQLGLAELTRTGRRGGCSCCSFTVLGLMALPLLTVIFFFVAR